MADDSDYPPSQEEETGPQGTRIFRRQDLDDRLSAQRAARAVRSTGAPPGAQLVGVRGSVRGLRFDVPEGRSTLGRDNQNDIIINADSISLVHARLIEKGGRYRVMNLLSTNGTWVNNKKVSDAPLRDGDSVCFGEAEFLFQQPQVPRHTSSGGLLGTLRRWFGR